MRYAEEGRVRVLFPLPGHEQDPRESWPWLPAVVTAVNEPDAFQHELEYVVVVEDERVAEYDNTSSDPDEPLLPIAFRDPSEVMPDRVTLS